MKIKIKNRELLTIFTFFISFIIYSASMFVWGMTNNARYVGIVLGIIQGLITVILSFSKKNIFFLRGKNVLMVLPLGCVFLYLSYFKAKENGMIMSPRVFVQISYLLFPAIYAFLLINILSLRTWDKLMRIILITSIILYFISTGINNFFILNNWLSISGGNSVFESSTYSGIFTISAFYFQYYGEVNNVKKEKFFAVLGVIFSVLSWKRLSVVFVFLLWIIGKYVNFNKKINKKIPIITALIFAPLTVFYTDFVEGKIQIFNLNGYQFTTGRTYTLSLWEKYGYISSGYGSSYEIIHRYLEMDLVQMYLEIGIIAIILFSICYFNMVGTSLYGYCIMVYEFLNLLTASSFPSIFEWILILVFIVNLNYKTVKEKSLYESGY